MDAFFVMRWNPAISSYKLEVYHRNCEDFPDGFRIDWSVWSHEQAHKGDRFVMMRVGDYKPGIVFYGTFVSEPYADDDWAGTDKKRQYVLMDCFGFKDNDEPIISADTLEKEIPEVNWMHGHSGEVISDEVAGKLTQILIDIIPGFSFNPAPPAYDDEEDCLNAVEKLQALVDVFASYNPSVHSQDEKEYDWLESDEEWSRCLLIPNPNAEGEDIKVETCGEFILYFGGSHAHYNNDAEGYEELRKDITEIVGGRMCAYSCDYEGWGCCCGINLIEPTEDAVREFLKSDNEYYIKHLSEYIEKDITDDGVYTIELRFFDSRKNKKFSFRLDELSDNIDAYRMRQDEV